MRSDTVECGQIQSDTEEFSQVRLNAVECRGMRVYSVGLVEIG